MKVLGVGYVAVQAEGAAYSLAKLEVFAGVYVSGKANATAGSNISPVVMQNPYGVKIALRSLQADTKLTLPAGGGNLELKNR